MPDLPLVGVTAVIAGMAAFSRDAAMVETSLLRIGRAADQLEAQTAGSFAGAGSQFASMASAVTGGALVIGGALALAGGAAIKYAADFQQSLALTQAITGASEQDIQGLTETIQDLARKGTVGMMDLAEGATDLAKSGVPIPDIMNGALKAVQDLTIASGGEISLDSAAKLVANSMHAFGLSVDDVTRITTAASVVAQNSSATFTDFGTAVAIAGPSFKSVGFTIEDLAGAETLLTNKGVNASTAATALRGVIQRLEKPSKDAAAVMQKYGIHLFDASGNAVTFRDLMTQLNTAFSDQAVATGKLTEQERDTAVATIGLQRTGAAFLVLANEGTDGIDNLADSFANLKAEDLVEVVLKPLNAQMKIAWNNVLVLAEVFGSQFLPALQASAAGLVSFLQAIPLDEAKQFGITVATTAQAIIAGIGSAIGTFAQFVAELGITDGIIQIIKEGIIGLAAVIVGGLVAGILSTLAAFGLFLAQITAVVVGIQVVSGWLSQGAAALANWASQFGVAGGIASGALTFVSEAAAALSAALSGDFVSAATHAGTAVQMLGDGIQTYVGGALDAIGKALDESGAQLAPWAAQFGDAGTIAGDALTGTHQVVEALQFALQGNFVAAANDARAAMQTFGGAAQLAGQDILTGLGNGVDWIANTGIPAVQTAFDNVSATIDGAFKASMNWLNTVGFPTVKSTSDEVQRVINTEVVPALQAIADRVNKDVQPALEWLANTGLKQVAEKAGDDAIKKLAEEIMPALGGSATSAAPHIGEVASNLGLVAKNANDLLRPLDDINRGINNFVTAGESLGHALTPIATLIGQIATMVAPLTSGISSTAVVFAVLAVTMAPVIAIMTGLGLLFATAGGAIKDFGVNISGATNPIVDFISHIDFVKTALVALGVAAFAPVIVPLKLLTVQFELASNMAKDLAGAFDFLVGAVGSAFSALGSFVVGVGGAFSVLGTTVQTVLAAVGGVFSALGTAAQTAIATVGGAFSALGSAVQAVAGAIGDAFSALGTAIQAVITAIGGAFSALGSAAQAAIAAVGDAFSGLGSAVSGALNAVIAAVGGFFSSLGSLVQAGLSDVANAFQSTWNQIPEDIRSDLGIVLRSVGDHFSQLGSTTQAGMGRVQSSIIEDLGNIVSAWGDRFSALGSATRTGVDNIVSIFEALGSRIVSTVNDAWSQLTDIVGSAMGAVLSAVQSGWEAVSSAVVDACTTVQGAVQDAWGQLSDVVGSAMVAVTDVVTSGWEAVSSAVESAMQTVGDAVASGWDQVTSVVGSAMSAVGAAVSAGWDAVTSAVTSGVESVTAAVSAGWDSVTSVTASAWAAVTGAITSALDTASAAVQGWITTVVGFFTGLAGQLAAAGATAGQAAVDGLVGAINGGIAAVGAAAANLARSALASAKEALDAHSPSHEFEVLGQDASAGLELGLLSSIPKAKAAANTYGDSILDAMQSFADGMDKLGEDTQAKLTSILQKASDSIKKTIDKETKSIEDAYQSTQAALDSLNGTLADPTSYAVREANLKKQLDAEKQAYQDRQAAEELAYQHSQDLAKADADFQKALAKENADFKAKIAADTNQKDIDRDNQAHTTALANLNQRRLDAIDSANQRFSDAQTDAARRRKLQDDERTFDAAQDAQATQLKQEELLQRRQDQIDAIQKATEQNIADTQHGADTERQVLLTSYQQKIDDLKKQLLQKIPPLTEAQAAALQTFLDNVESAMTDTTNGLVDSMGVQTNAAINSVGQTAKTTLGTGGTVPNAATTAQHALGDATGAADDLRGDKTSGMLGAKDSATQISFVLQELNDKMPSLVKEVDAFVASLNNIHDVTVTVTTNYVSNGAPGQGGSSSGGGGGGGSSSGSSSKAGNTPTGNEQRVGDTPSDQGARDALRAAGNFVDASGVYKLAKGGVITSPTYLVDAITKKAYALMAEAGPEAIVPLSGAGSAFSDSLKSEVGALAKAMAGAGGSSTQYYNYNVNASYADTQSPASVTMDMQALVMLARVGG